MAPSNIETVPLKPKSVLEPQSTLALQRTGGSFTAMLAAMHKQTHDGSLYNLHHHFCLS